MLKFQLTSYLAFTIILISSVSHARSQCFQGKLRFFQPYLKLNATSKDLYKMLEPTCFDLSKASNHDSSRWDGLDSLTINLIAAGFGQAKAAFETLQDTDLERSFMQRLEEIKKIANPMERIRKVYELSTSYQGYYDKEGKVGSGGITPSSALANYQEKGTMGVCRHYSSLLTWSLMQVSRHSESNTMHLGPNDFSADFYPLHRKKHAWVRVNLPRHDKDGRLLGFQRFDLDPTWYPESFHMLMPRHLGISEDTRLRAYQQCLEIRNCLK